MKALAPLLVGAAAAIVLALAAVRQTDAAAEAWLAAELFWIGLPLGALFIRLAHELTGGAWGASLTAPLTPMIDTAPLLSILFLPVILAVAQIYPWAQARDQVWLTPRFFDLRAVLYLILWNGAVFLLRRFRGTNFMLPAAIAWPGLIVLFGTTSLAGFDWIMSLEPRWTSTVFGLLVTAGWVLSALAAAIAMIASSRTATPEVLDTLARLLLGLVFLWAYFAVVQLVVIWESDLQKEIPWYLKRTTPGWMATALAFVLLQFILPFVILAWEPLRRNRAAVLAVALAIVVAHLLEIWWLTAPDFAHAFGWLEPLAVIAIGGGTVFILQRGFDRTPRPSAGAMS